MPRCRGTTRPDAIIFVAGPLATAPPPPHTPTATQLHSPSLEPHADPSAAPCRQFLVPPAAPTIACCYRVFSSAPPPVPRVAVPALHSAPHRFLPERGRPSLLARGGYGLAVGQIDLVFDWAVRLRSKSATSRQKHAAAGASGASRCLLLEIKTVPKVRAALQDKSTRAQFYPGLWAAWACAVCLLVL